MRTIQLKSGLPRAVEVAMALLALILAMPLLLLCAFALTLIGGGPVLFRQQRVGRNGRNFTLYKLRTMRAGGGGPQVTAKGDVRITPIGRILRKTKLDEFPEFWNVVKGDMSLVGPRPEVPGYVDLDSRCWQIVLKARPGITDPVTLNLRNEEAILADLKEDHERFYLETLQPLKLQGYLQYLSKRSWRTDLKVLCQTFLIVVFPSAGKDSLSFSERTSPQPGSLWGE